MVLEAARALASCDDAQKAMSAMALALRVTTRLLEQTDETVTLPRQRAVDMRRARLPDRRHICAKLSVSASRPLSSSHVTAAAASSRCTVRAAARITCASFDHGRHQSGGRKSTSAADR